MTINEKLEPIFVDKNKLPPGISLIGKIEACDAVIETGCQGTKPLIDLHQLVRAAVFNQVHQQYGTEQQVYLVSTNYKIEPYFGGLIGLAHCDVYGVPITAPLPNYIPEPIAFDPAQLEHAKRLLAGDSSGTVMDWKV